MGTKTAKGLGRWVGSEPWISKIQTSSDTLSEPIERKTMRTQVKMVIRHLKKDNSGHLRLWRELRKSLSE
jgi:hypothetical protein